MKPGDKLSASKTDAEAVGEPLAVSAIGDQAGEIFGHAPLMRGETARHIGLKQGANPLTAVGL